MKTEFKLLEQVANIQHSIWSHWMEYVFTSCGRRNEDGSFTIPAKFVDRWERQLQTDYSDLTDKEKKSDKEQARYLLDAIFSNTDIS